MLYSSSMFSAYEASNSEVVPLLCLYKGSSQEACWFCRHLVALDVQIASQFVKDFADVLVCVLADCKWSTWNTSDTRFVG